jgi:dCMP deaminase
MKKKQIKNYSQLTYAISQFSKDPDKKVGSIFLHPKTFQILSTGYNGFPRKVNETNKRWKKPEKYKWVVHSEQNGIYNATLNGVKLKNSILFTTKFPCNDCAKGLIQAGIKQIYTYKPDLKHKTWGESMKISLKMFKETNIRIHYLD